MKYFYKNVNVCVFGEHSYSSSSSSISERPHEQTAVGR
jgi:hypothetical protein